MKHVKGIEKSIKYIEENLNEKISLDDLASKAFMSKYHYHRVFHDVTGETVMDFIRRRRLAEAASELINSEEKVIDIALKYQFGSQESFSRAFRKQFGISPREYRRSVGGNAVSQAGIQMAA